MNLEFDVIQQYQITFERAVELYNLFEDNEIAQLLASYSILEQDVNKLILLAEIKLENCGSLGRHLRFLKYYLELNQKDNCKGDIKDILFYDLPTTFKTIISAFSSKEDIDQKLQSSVYILIREKQYDSVIRKAFVILTERLRDVCKINNTNTDGEHLINEIFGKDSKCSMGLDSNQRKGYRNLLSGLYELYRNKYAHNNLNASYIEVEGVLGMINNILLDVEKLPLEHQ